MRHEPTNRDDIIDSRDIIKRVAELEDERDSHKEAAETYAEENRLTFDEDAEQETWNDTEEGQELKALKALADQAEGYADDWTYGASLIRDSYFETYAQDLAEDIGAVPRDVTLNRRPCYPQDRMAGAPLYSRQPFPLTGAGAPFPLTG